MKSRNILFFQYPWRLWRERLAGVYRYAKKVRWQVSVAEYGRNFESIAAALKFWRPDGLIVEPSLRISGNRIYAGDVPARSRRFG